MSEVLTARVTATDIIRFAAKQQLDDDLRRQWDLMQTDAGRISVLAEQIQRLRIQENEK